MKTYTATKNSPSHNTVIAEINTKVLTATFPGKGTHKADVYSSPNTANQAVFHGSCSPSGSTFVETINIAL